MGTFTLSNCAHFTNSIVVPENSDLGYVCKFCGFLAVILSCNPCHFFV